MAQILETGDENAGQEMTIPVPGRASPLRIRTVSAGSIGGGVPWGSASFVDPQTTLAPAAQTGAPGTPYESAQLAADNSTDGNAIVLGPGDAGSLALVSQAFTYFGFGLISQSFTAFDRPRIDAVSFSDATGSNLANRFVNIEVTGAVDLNFEGYLGAEGSQFDDTVTGALLCELVSCYMVAALTCSQVVARDTIFEGVINTNSCTFRDCTTSADVVLASGTFRNHTFAVAQDVNGADVSIDCASLASWHSSVSTRTGGGFAVLDGPAVAAFWGASTLTTTQFLNPWAPSGFTVAAATTAWIPTLGLRRVAHSIRATIGVAQAVDITFTLLVGATVAGLAATALTVTIPVGNLSAEFDLTTSLVTVASGDIMAMQVAHGGAALSVATQVVVGLS